MGKSCSYFSYPLSLGSGIMCLRPTAPAELEFLGCAWLAPSVSNRDCSMCGCGSKGRGCSSQVLVPLQGWLQERRPLIRERHRSVLHPNSGLSPRGRYLRANTLGCPLTSTCMVWRLRNPHHQMQTPAHIQTSLANGSSGLHP